MSIRSSCFGARDSKPGLKFAEELDRDQTSRAGDQIGRVVLAIDRNRGGDGVLNISQSEVAPRLGKSIFRPTAGIGLGALAPGSKSGEFVHRPELQSLVGSEVAAEFFEITFVVRLALLIDLGDDEAEPQASQRFHR